MQHGSRNKNRHYLEVPIERHNALHSHSLLPLDSGESAPAFGSRCLSSISRQTPEMPSNSKEFKVKDIQERANL